MNVSVSAKSQINIVCKKYYIWNPNTCTRENGKYLGSIIDNSVITCDEITESSKSVPTKRFPTTFNEKKATCIIKKLYKYILLDFF